MSIRTNYTGNPRTQRKIDQAYEQADKKDKYFTSDEASELNDLLNCYDEIPVLSWMRCVNWSHYIECIERQNE